LERKTTLQGLFHCPIFEGKRICAVKSNANVCVPRVLLPSKGYFT